jgi:Ca2+-binding RTX toxin-like protein
VATLAEVQNTYLAINRAPLDQAAASAVLRAIEQGQTTLASYTSDLIQKAASTTGAAIAISAFITGFAPTSQHLDELKVAADAQIASYKSLGVANPALGAFEAFGKGFAADPTTGFAAKYGTLSTDAFIAAVYGEVFGKAPPADALANLQAQIAYFANLYSRNGISQQQADLQAKGAALGQIVGYAFLDPKFADASTLDDRVAVFLSKAASGDTTIFGAPLPPISGGGSGGPAPVPMMFSLTLFTDTFAAAGGADLFMAGPGTLNAGDTLDGGGGGDILIVSGFGESLVGVTLTSIEEIRLVNGSTLAADLNSLGSFAFGHAAATDNGDVTLAIDLAGATSFDLSGVTAGLAGTPASGIKASYANVATTALNVTLSGLADTFTGTGQADIINAGAGNDTINGGAGADTINGGDGDDRVTFAAADGDTVNGGSGRDTLVITGGSLAFDLTAPAGAITSFEVFDASAVTGALVTNVATNPGTTTAFTVMGSALADTITTGAGNDVLTMGVAGQTIAYDTLDAGGGTDTLIIVGNVTTGTIAQNLIDLSLPGDQVTKINNAAEAVTQTGFENLDLSRVVPGTGVGFSITAHAGGSTIAGTPLTDFIFGGVGNDIIVGWLGTDKVDGGGGTNTLALINGGTTGLFTATNVQFNAINISTDSNLLNIQNITLSGSTLMTLTLTGQTEGFVISASAATASEVIIAGNGADTITGSSLGDFIDGGLGADRMTGGTGFDTFRFEADGSVAGTAMDVITDFAANTDRLSFSTVAALRAADSTALVAGANVQQTAGGL